MNIHPLCGWIFIRENELKRRLPERENVKYKMSENNLKVELLRLFGYDKEMQRWDTGLMWMTAVQTLL